MRLRLTSRTVRHEKQGGLRYLGRARDEDEMGDMTKSLVRKP